MAEKYSVAIDGPSGAGKSTLAKAAAAALGICYVDTGAIYRTIGYGVYRRGIDPSDAGAVAAVLPDMQLEMRYDQAGLQRMMLAGEDVTDQIRLPEMSRYASIVSAIPAVRDFLLELQREQARRHSVIMDGRDIGTVVLPDATVKIFLTAAPEVRAMRRFRELEQRGTSQPYDQVLREIVDRDYADTHRAIAPLRRAEDAVELDTGALTFEESLRLLLETAPKGFTPDWVRYEKGKGWQLKTEKPPIGSYDAIRVYLWVGMLHDGDKQKARLLQRFAPMAAQTTEQGVPPEKVNIATGKTSGQGPVGFSAAMLPFLQDDEARSVQRQRVADNYPGADAYYSAVLTLFGQGWDQHRFRFTASGELQPDWNQECASSH